MAGTPVTAGREPRPHKPALYADLTDMILRYLCYVPSGESGQFVAVTDKVIA